MADNVGTMTPITPPIPGGGDALVVARALPWTHLSPARYAQIMGINPIFIMGATITNYFEEFADCERPWPRHTFQSSDQASMEDLILSIKEAEQDIAHYLGYNVGPDWVTGDDKYQWPLYRNNHFTNGINELGRRTGIQLRRGEFIAGGRRAVELIELSATVSYTDQDGDLFEETATIAVTTTVTDWREIKVYVPGKGGDRRWEIRTPRSVSLSAGIATIVFDSWQLVDPDIASSLPQASYTPVDLADAAQVFSTVDVYREYNDTTQSACELIWERRPAYSCSYCGGIGCAECTPITQGGCLVSRSQLAGFVVPTPGSYSSGAWASAEFTGGRSPDQVKMWYYSGYRSEEYLVGYSNDPLDQWLAEAIAVLATARLEREICICNSERIKRLQDEAAFSSEAGNFLAISDDLQASPFGTKVGEVQAYRRVKRAKKHKVVAVL